MSAEIDKLKQSNNELREIINNSWNGIGIIDKNSKFIYVNNAFSPILGYPKEELLQMTFEDLMLDDSYKKDFKELLEQNIANKYTTEVQVVCQRKDKKNVYLQITVSLMLNQKFYVVNAKDITKQISDDEILDKYVMSTHTDLNRIITKVSSAFSSLSGYSKKELLGQDQNILLHKDTSQATIDALWETVKTNNEWSGNLKCIKKDGSPFWLNIRLKPMYNKYGDITGFTTLMFDITNELILASQKKNLTNQVSVAQDEIKQKDQILVQQSKLAIMAETLQMVSHEWRQPLNIISIQAQKLELEYSMDLEPNPEKVVAVLENIKNTAGELSQTIEEFQNYINLKSVKKIVDPKTVINKAIETFKNDREAVGIDFVKDIMEDTPSFETYQNELTTILVNMLINSKEAILRNGVKNGVIKLKQYYLDEMIYFEISDNGKGIKEEILGKIFEPYFSTKELQHGVGLGLYTCKMIIETHLGGSIEATNHSTGARFIIKLPMK
ncbi:MAG: PAS domain S-box protein [Candidatus Marinarcus sp.]|uniref:PAS domain-containing sensor histidine kinase n=1 Tax=Candidatus Marinarcus sp. TaxID=3100987 RepID=UPI003B001A45